MKTSNVKVKFKDLKQGITIFVSHPVYGIEELKVLGKTFLKPIGYKKVYFVNVLHSSEYGNFETDRSLRDMGVYDSYNGRRVFFKRKHAEEWMRKWSKQPSFIKHQKEHEDMCRHFDDLYEY